MSIWHPFHEGIRLHVKDRISAGDAARQETTARAILGRFSERPGLVLADEVGMGKTFVALAVAASVALSDRRRPVVVMVPSALKEKWPRDFGVFAEQCLRARIRCTSAETGVQFLKCLDNPPGRRASIIFLTHGAMSRTLTDGWVRLAIIHRALHRRHDQRLRTAVGRCAASLVEVSSRTARHPKLCASLLAAPLETWRDVMRKHGFEPEAGDDPVPHAVIRALRDFDADEVAKVYAALDRHVPRNETESYEDRLKVARVVLRDALKKLWAKSLGSLEFKLPLLILDEAHHLKNEHTQLARLIHTPEALADAEMMQDRGALEGVFERMLFLTATPFQLGHHELCSVLKRFGGVAWNTKAAPPGGREEFWRQVATLRDQLDKAQQAALTLDSHWGQLREDDLVLDGKPTASVDAWWTGLVSAKERSPQAEQVLTSYRSTAAHMRAAEVSLRPWVIRHLRPRTLPAPWHNQKRRVRLGGRAIVDDKIDEGAPGLALQGGATLPFLLAARAAVCAPDARPLFAEGLASSYEAFRHTRKGAGALDEDSALEPKTLLDDSGRWYLAQLDRALPLADHAASASHPKIAATAARVLAAWRQGEKVLVFCHFIQTGRTLRRVISRQIRDEIFGEAAKRLNCTPAKAESLIERIGARFFDHDSPARRACDALTSELLVPHRRILRHGDRLRDIVRRFVRTPSFLVRYFPIENESLDEAAVRAAFAHCDLSRVSLAQMLRSFFESLERRCSSSERKPLLRAIDRMKTGDITTLSDDEQQGDDHAALLANVRLVNGATGSETRQRLMLTFNSPFFPEVLIASSVMAEGVDLHRFCRYVIHHDLDWNPSMLEQRTGRVDRIGGKVETYGQPIRIYLPYIAETQDEKMYRVVMDRERWFNVVMGEQFKVDARTTEMLAQRIPLPAALAEQLAFRLEVQN